MFKTDEKICYIVWSSISVNTAENLDKYGEFRWTKKLVLFSEVSLYPLIHHKVLFHPIFPDNYW